MSLIEKLENLSDLYNVYYYFSTVHDKEYLELNTEDILDKGCLVHINMVLKNEDYVFDTIEAFNDVLVLNYYKK